MLLFIVTNLFAYQIARYSALHGQVLILKYILRYHKELAKSGSLSDPGTTILMNACRSNSTDTIKVVLQYGANPNFVSGVSFDGPIHVATSKRNQAAILLLLQHGADINSPNHFGSRPIDLAMCHDDFKTAEFLIKHGADLALIDKYDYTSLHGAAYSDSVAWVSFLLSHGCNPNVINNEGETPLFYTKSSMIMLLLLQHGAKINYRNGSGETALFNAVRANSYDSVDFLLKHGANCKISNNKGYTPLHYVASINIARLLLKYGADPKSN